jgi:hypothetical protein
MRKFSVSLKEEALPVLVEADGFHIADKIPGAVTFYVQAGTYSYNNIALFQDVKRVMEVKEANE